MYGTCVDMDLVADAERLLGRDVPEHVVRMIAHRFLLQEDKLFLQRRFPVDPVIPLMPNGIRIQLADIFVPARSMGYIE
jgi:hypothetical protein